MKTFLNANYNMSSVDVLKHNNAWVKMTHAVLIGIRK